MGLGQPRRHPSAFTRHDGGYSVGLLQESCFIRRSEIWWCSEESFNWNIYRSDSDTTRYKKNKASWLSVLCRQNNLLKGLWPKSPVEKGDKTINGPEWLSSVDPWTLALNLFRTVIRSPIRQSTHPKPPLPQTHMDRIFNVAHCACTIFTLSARGKEPGLNSNPRPLWTLNFPLFIGALYPPKHIWIPPVVPQLIVAFLTPPRPPHRAVGLLPGDDPSIVRLPLRSLPFPFLRSL